MRTSIFLIQSFELLIGDFAFLVEADLSAAFVAVPEDKEED